MKYLNVGVIATVLLLCLLPAHQSVRAQRNTADYLFWGSTVGYSRLLGSTPNMNVDGLVTGGLHIGWEVRKLHFLYRPIFLDLQYFSSRCNTSYPIPDAPIRDARLGEAIMHYDMLSPLTETERFFIPSVGFMLGYSGNNNTKSKPQGAFYLLGGLKVSAKFDVSNNVTLKYRTTATYERYIDDYEDMPNHHYDEMASSSKEKFGLKIGVIASLEMGWELNLNRFDKLKIGGFADCGLTPIMYGNEKASTLPDNNDATKVLVHSYYKSPEMNGKYVVPLMVGLKITYSFNMNFSRDCLKINCRMGYRQLNK